MSDNGRIVGVGHIGNVNIVPTRLVSIHTAIWGCHHLHFCIPWTGQFIEISELDV